MQQNEQGEWHPVEYWSKKLNQTQQNYHPAQKETCAILYALEHRRHLLSGQHFSVDTDNKASHFLNTKSTEHLSPREMRWIEKSAYFAPFTFEYRLGLENTRTDYLSRHSAKVYNGPVYCILDLSGGMGTTLHAHEIALPPSTDITIDYAAVEREPDCRSVIQRVFSQIRRARFWAIYAQRHIPLRQ